MPALSAERERQARAEAEHKYRVTLSQLEALTDHEGRLREEKADLERRLANTAHDLKEVSRELLGRAGAGSGNDGRSRRQGPRRRRKELRRAGRTGEGWKRLGRSLKGIGKC